jgi:hypothetical protein
MLYFGRVGSSWGHRAFFDSSWGEKVITPSLFQTKLFFKKKKKKRKKRKKRIRPDLWLAGRPQI